MADFNYDLLLDTGATFSSIKNKKVVTQIKKAKKPITMVTQTGERKMENIGECPAWNKTFG